MRIDIPVCSMKKILWSEEKNDFLKTTRGISFEEIRDAIIENEDYDWREHHLEKY